MSPTGPAIDRRSPIPLYLQIVEHLLRDIRTKGEEGRAGPLPSETELIRRYKVSRVTIRHALQELERMGVIYREKGKGTFATRPRLKGIAGFGSFTDEVSREGRRPSSQVLEFGLVDALPAKMQERFHLPAESHERDRFVLLKRLRLIDDRPVALDEAYLPHDQFPGLEEVDFDSSRSLFDTLSEYWGVVPVWAEALIESVAATPAEAEILHVSPGDPLLVAWRISLTETDETIEYVKAVYSGREFLFNLGRHRID